MPALKDWEAPATWAVGDLVSADTWTDRVYNPLSLLLRRPLLVARRTTDQTCAANNVATPCGFDTIDQDDDGMVMDDITAGAVTTFYAQRDGVYACYWAATFESNTHQGTHQSTSVIAVNAVLNYSRSAPTYGSTSTQDNWRAGAGDVYLSEGDTVQLQFYNTDSSTINVKAEFNAPRLAILWKRPLGG